MDRLSSSSAAHPPTPDSHPTSPSSTSKSSSCTFCKRRHIKCDGKNPCNQCVRRNQTCKYGTRGKTGPKPKLSAHQLWEQLTRDIETQNQIADYWKNRYLTLKAKMDLTESDSGNSAISTSPHTTPTNDKNTRKNTTKNTTNIPKKTTESMTIDLEPTKSTASTTQNKANQTPPQPSWTSAPNIGGIQKTNTSNVSSKPTTESTNIPENKTPFFPPTFGTRLHHVASPSKPSTYASNFDSGSLLSSQTSLADLWNLKFLSPKGILPDCYFDDFDELPPSKPTSSKNKANQPKQASAPEMARVLLALDLFESCVAPLVSGYKYERSLSLAMQIWDMSNSKAYLLSAVDTITAFEQVIALANGFKYLQDEPCTQLYQTRISDFIKIIFFVRDLQMVPSFADKLVQLLIHASAFYTGDDRDGFRHSLIMLSYQLVSLHRKHVSPASMHRAFMLMMSFSENQRDRQYWFEEASRCELESGISEVHSFRQAHFVIYVFCSIHPRMSYETQRPNYSARDLYGFLQILESSALLLAQQHEFMPLAKAFPDITISFHLFVHGTRAECLFLLGDHRVALRIAKWVIEGAVQVETPTFLFLFAIQSSLEICFVMKQMDWVYRAVSLLDAHSRKLPLAAKLNKRNRTLFNIQLPPPGSLAKPIVAKISPQVPKQTPQSWENIIATTPAIGPPTAGLDVMAILTQEHSVPDANPKDPLTMANILARLQTHPSSTSDTSPSIPDLLKTSYIPEADVQALLAISSLDSNRHDSSTTSSSSKSSSPSSPGFEAGKEQAFYVDMNNSGASTNLPIETLPNPTPVTSLNNRLPPYNLTTLPYQQNHILAPPSIPYPPQTSVMFPPSNAKFPSHNSLFEQPRSTQFQQKFPGQTGPLFGQGTIPSNINMLGFGRHYSPQSTSYFGITPPINSNPAHHGFPVNPIWDTFGTNIHPTGASNAHMNPLPSIHSDGEMEGGKQTSNGLQSSNVTQGSQNTNNLPPISLLNGPNASELAASVSAATEMLDGEQQYPMFFEQFNSSTFA